MKFIRRTCGRAFVLRALALVAIAGLVWAGQRADGTEHHWVAGDCIEFCVYYWSEGGDNWAETNPPPVLCDKNGEPVQPAWSAPPNPGPGDGPAYRNPEGNEVTPLDKSQPFPRVSDGPAGGKIVEYCWIHCPEPPLAPGESVEIHVQYMDSTGQMKNRTIRHTKN